MVESVGVPSYQTMGTLRMQVEPGLCGLEQLWSLGVQQALLMRTEREMAVSVLAERGGPQ